MNYFILISQRLKKLTRLQFYDNYDYLREIYFVP